MAAPPLDAGDDHETVAWVFPDVADTSMGASGVVAGVAETVLEGIDEPTLFVARTL